MKYFALFVIAAAVGLSACSSPDQAVNHAGMNHNTPAAVDHNGMDSSNNSADHAGMDHASMKSSPGAADAPYDLQFLDTMIAHHQGAVDMAEPAKEKAGHAELASLAALMVGEQKSEIAQMKKWREAWFAGKPEAINMSLAGMADSMKDMDMKKLSSLNKNDFDLEFIKQMIPHHEGAVEMAKEALKKADKQEIKTLANAVIKVQDAEISKMKAWQKEWSK